MRDRKQDTKRLYLKNLKNLKNTDMFNYEPKELELKQILAVCSEILSIIPERYGDCVHLSTLLHYKLKESNISSIVVEGSLKVNNRNLFKHTTKLPTPTSGNKIIEADWVGHCWVNIGNYVIDLSIFRTINTYPDGNFFKNFFIEKFGHNGGAVIFPINQKEIDYIPKSILTRPQLESFFAGLQYICNNSI